MSEHDGPVRRSTCPDAATVAAYLDGTLPVDARGGVEGHLDACAECRWLVADVLRLSEAMDANHAGRGSARSSRGHRRWKWPAVGTLAAAAAILLAAFVPWRESSPTLRPADRPELAALVAAVGDRRPFEARLTGGFLHGDPARLMRGDGDAWDAPASVRAAAAALEQAASEREPRTLAAQGSAELLLGRTDAALRLIERAVRLAPDDAALWSDLAAACLVQAATLGSSEAAASALEAADRALALVPDLPEALYNRALALERLGRRAEAGRAWHACAKADPAAGWAEDARRRAATTR